MTNYDFLILSAEEFERFSRDLLQKVLNINIESFTTGKDSGIDLRYATSSDNFIIQCKRYSDFNNLYSNLKKEVKKVKKINPDRYILTTAVGLTPNNKEKIMELFDGLIKHTSDVMGKDDLNNYLSQHSSIEEKYYKLWISSTNILNKIINANVYNQTEFKKNEIEEKTKLFVQDKSFDEALKILSQYKYVVISGIPGIGKTTLGSFLAYYLLAKGSEEFIYISESISEAFSLFKPEKKQVFFFDDFLGQSNFSREKLAINEEKRILDFLDMINKTKNKFMIFTTCEYILQQAKMALEKLNAIGDEYKCIVDLQKYNKESKGRILYNHLFYYNLPEKYIQIIINEKFYMKIINHKNYSPRIIEYIVKEGFWKNTTPEQYLGKVFEAFENPELLWEHVYDNQITELSRCILAVLTTIGGPIALDDLNNSARFFLEKYSSYFCSFSESDFRKSIKELEDTFIFNNKINGNRIITKFQNPSIHDFLCHYFSKNIKYMECIIDTALYINQLFEVFTTYEGRKTLIQIGADFINKRLNKLFMDYEDLQFLKIVINDDGRLSYYYTTKGSNIYKLHYVLKRVNENELNKLNAMLTQVLLKIEVSSLEDDEIEEYLDSIKILGKECLAELVKRNIFQTIFANMKTDSELVYFQELKNIDEIVFNNCIRSDSNKDRILKICWESEFDYSDKDLEYCKDNLETISLNYNIDLDDTIQSVNERIDDYKKRMSQYEPDYDLIRNEQEIGELIDDSVIHEMFNSLKER